MNIVEKYLKCLGIIRDMVGRGHRIELLDESRAWVCCAHCESFKTGRVSSSTAKEAPEVYLKERENLKKLLVHMPWCPWERARKFLDEETLHK